MSTHPEHPRKKKAHEHVLDAAAADPHDDLHATDAAPAVFELKPEQVTLLRSLQFLSAFELAHTAKTSPDAPTAFGETALATIGSSVSLGGKERATAIDALLAKHQKLVAIGQILGPLARLVGQNLLATDAQLAGHAGAVLKLANIVKSTEPHLVEGLAETRAWSKSHHPGHGSTHAAPAIVPATTSITK